MQFRAVVCSALFSAVGAVTALSEVRARVWLSSHQGTPDELDALKTENPDAYALVKALLTKRSLGLLDPKHPTASFAAPPPQSDEDKTSGSAMYAKFATTEKEKEALQGKEVANLGDPYPDARPVSHYWINWKPHDNAGDDAMVNNVLGAVADLTKGKSLRGADVVASGDGSPLAAETAAMAEAPTEQVTTTPAVTQQEDSSFKDSDLIPVQSTKFGSPPDTSGNVLESFRLDNSTTTPTVQTLRPGKGSGNPLASWLGMVNPRVQVAASVDLKPPGNPYLMALQ